MTKIHCLVLPLIFPSGLSAGEGRDSNVLAIARDGKGRALLRGTALAGVLRSRYHAEEDELEWIFGCANSDESSEGTVSARKLRRSKLEVCDTELKMGKAVSVYRSHNSLDRHTRTVRDGLFSLEACPPNTTATPVLWLRQPDDKEDPTAFFQEVVELFTAGVTLGGHGNRGIGLAKLKSGTAPRLLQYDLSNRAELANYLNDHREWRSDPDKLPAGGVSIPLLPAAEKVIDRLTVEFSLTIPPGQDILIGDGQFAPQKVRGEDGAEYWRLPGSSLRGLFRAWVSRLAAREGAPVSDSLARYEKDGKASGDEIGWCFKKEDERREMRKKGSRPDCRIADLFGSNFKPGRVHIADAYSLCDPKGADVQTRKHVAVDRITGGANEGMLFETKVLTRATFPVVMTLDYPNDADQAHLKQDAHWLATALRALHVGVLRVGSSKSAGRLELLEKPKPRGGPVEIHRVFEDIISACSNAPINISPITLTVPAPVASSNTKRSGAELVSGLPELPRKIGPVRDQFISAVGKGLSEKLESVRKQLSDYEYALKNGTQPPAEKDKQLKSVHAWLRCVEEQLRALNPSSVPVDGVAALGLAFINPYTFIPFPENVKRDEPTPLTMDEADRQRITGVLELEIKTESPLLTCAPEPVDANAPHKKFRALSIGSNVIVPATGIRGSLRTLLTILAGGTLGYVDEDVYLCQDRDAKLGPKGKKSSEGTPLKCFLARIIKPGSATQDGVVKLGKTELVFTKNLNTPNGLELLRPKNKETKVPKLWSNSDGSILRDWRSVETPWQVKLSGKLLPGSEEFHREGLFLDNGPELTLPKELWRAYAGRNIHGARPVLMMDDLVWLEPSKADLTQLRIADDIKSIQWARWGREGQRLTTLIQKHHPAMMPDYLRADGNVDEVTNLFGQVPLERGLDRKGKAPSFAARVSPENLVFSNGINNLAREVPLAPLSPPHPGCLAFYRKPEKAQLLSKADPLRGYKVYRTSVDRGDKAPWLFSTQGVYDNGVLKLPQQKVNKTCDLLKEGCVGTLRIAFRALNPRELGLLLLACNVNWRLGGGKPLGLGLCSVSIKGVRDELGVPLSLPANWADSMQTLLPRAAQWMASQKPVANMRYPRAIDHKTKQRGGHSWFGRHATPKKEQDAKGLEPMHLKGALAQMIGTAELPGQLLPMFDPLKPEAGVLYGYEGL